MSHVEQTINSQDFGTQGFNIKVFLTHKEFTF